MYIINQNRLPTELDREDADDLRRRDVCQVRAPKLYNYIHTYIDR